MKIINENLDNCQKFMDFGKVEFPQLKHEANKSINYTKKSHAIFQADIVRKVRVDLIRSCFKALKQNYARKQHNEFLKRNVINKFAKYWKNQYFHKWKVAN